MTLGSSSAPSRWQLAAAALSLVAGWIHVFVAPEHFEEWIGYGVFFVVVSVFQTAFAFLLLARTPPRRDLLWAGILGNAAVIALWAVTRTLGVPFFGPAAGEVEAVGALDAISKAAELGLVVCLLQMVRVLPDVQARVESR